MALARLASGRYGAETDAMIAATLPTIVDCHDCADFALVPLLWCRTAYGQHIGKDVVAKIDEAILSYRYWMDEPGNDVQWYFSENHALLFHTACYLAGALHPEKRLPARVGWVPNSRPLASSASALGSIISRSGKWPSSTPPPISPSISRA